MRANLNLNIAGLSHRCTEADNGSYTGYTKAEPTNAYDPEAIAIFGDNGRMYGYIPQNMTSLVRIWGKGRTDFKCSFSIDIHNDGYRTNYWGRIELVDDSYPSLPIQSKYFYFGKRNTKSVFNLEDWNIQSVNASAKVVDYVVTDDPESLPKGITKRDLPQISYEEFDKMLYDEIEPNEYKGKNICIVFKSDLAHHQIVRDYLIECGATVTDKYSKRNTDIVIDRQEYGLLKATKQAIEDGKTVLMINDVIRKLGYDIQDKPEKELSTSQKNTQQRAPNIQSSASTNFYKAQPKDNSGCMVGLIIGLASLIAALFL